MQISEDECFKILLLPDNPSQGKNKKGQETMGSERPPKFRAKAPWYRNADYYRYMAREYLEKLSELPPDSPQRPEVNNSRALNWPRLIFESNLIEKAGLRSEGETRKLIQETFPVLSEELRDFAPPLLKQDGSLQVALPMSKLQDVCRIIMKNVPSPTENYVLGFAGRSRPTREVLQHHQALDHARDLTLDFHESSILELIIDGVKSMYRSKPDERDLRLNLIRTECGKKRFRHKRLLTHTNLKKLHHILAHGLIPDDAGVPAGKYRIDNRSVGWDLAFPAPELVKESMDHFMKRADELITDLTCCRSEKDLIEIAAEISYHFVRIHPFPDFNGRLSRIIMNMVLPLGGCPIPIAIRGDAKGRKRYFTALRHANRGDMKSLEALIAMRTVETFQEIDKNLELAGLPTIWSVEVD